MIKKLILISIMVTISLTIFNKRNSLKKKVKEMNFKQSKVTIVQYNDNGLWSDPIVDGFINDLQKSIGDNKLIFTIIKWDPEKDILKKIQNSNPEILFLTDDLFYDLYASHFIETDIKILSLSMYKTPNELLAPKKELGVYNDYPAREVLKMANRFFPLKKIAYISGPIDGAKKIARIVKEQAPKSMIMDEFYSDQWEEWKEKLLEFEASYDAIWLVTPFSVKDGGKDLDHQKFAHFVKNLNIPTIGFCTLYTDFKRTLTIGVNPKQLGLASAAVLYNYLINNISKIEPYTSFDIAISQKDLFKFGKSVPDDLTAFIK